MQSVLVIGGGPAGASFASRMAALGASVVLVERHAFPRRALGESLTPGVEKLLDSIGVSGALPEAGVQPARDVRVLWDGDAPAMLRSGADGLLADRGHFDRLLLAHAMRLGVRVLQPCEILSLRRRGGGWRAEVVHDGAHEMIDVRILADARGRRGLAGNPRQAMGQRALALYGYWRGGRTQPHATIAAGEHGWFWGIPLPDGSYNAQVFLSPGGLQGGGRDTLEQRYRTLLANSELAGALADARLEGPVRATDATSYLAAEPVTADKIRLGDAALTLDPLSSSGVQKAIQSALAGAIVVNTLLRRPATTDAALGFYRDSLVRTATRHAQWAGEHYAVAARTRPDRFWTSRALETVEPNPPEPTGPEEVVQLSPLARIAETACLGAEFVEVKEALVHPALDGPIAYLGNHALAPLLAALPERARLIDLARGWGGLVPPSSSLAIAAWLRRKAVLVPPRAVAT